MQLKGATVADLKGRSGAVKKCVVIPIEDADLYLGTKGVYLNLTAWEQRQPYYGETHSLKVDLSKEAYQRLTDEERRAMPIVGGLKPFESRISQTPAQAAQAAQQGGAMQDGQADDLPF